MSQQFFCGEMSPRACSGALARCTGMARRRGQRTLRGNINVYRARARATFLRTRARAGLRALQVLRCSAAQHEGTPCRQRPPSQRSLHNAPIFRLLLKVAVNGTHQCGFFNFCGASWTPTLLVSCALLSDCASEAGLLRVGARGCVGACERAASCFGATAWVGWLFVAMVLVSGDGMVWCGDGLVGCSDGWFFHWWMVG